MKTTPAVLALLFAALQGLPAIGFTPLNVPGAAHTIAYDVEGDAIVGS